VVLIIAVLKGVDTQDFSLILYYYGIDTVEQVLNSAIDEGFITDKIIAFIRLRLKVAKPILNEL
jgi:hypothetical protein